MSGFFKNQWENLTAICGIVRQNFVRWFLPLHSDDDEEDLEQDEFEDERSSPDDVPPLRDEEMQPDEIYRDDEVPDAGAHEHRDETRPPV